MSETESKPILALGEPPGRLAKERGSRANRWMGMVIVLQLVTIAALVILIMRSQAVSTASVGRERIERLRATAIALEDRSLAAEAAAAWRAYLRSYPEAEDRAEVLYRIGRLLMEAEDFSTAAAALVEAEQLAEKGSTLKSNVGPRIVECLRRLGRYGEVGRELSRQVEVGGEEMQRGKVLARFAGESFTEADLDRVIERTVDRALAMQPGESAGVTREQLLRQYASGEVRRRMFQEVLQRELFSRRARELKLDRTEAFLQSQELLQTDLLASQFLSQELERIQPTDVDIESYYQAHLSDYRQPESASVLAIPLKEGQTADEVLSQVSTADDFRRIADERDAAAMRITRNRPDARLGDTGELFDLNEGEWTKSAKQGPGGRWLVLMESKRAAVTPPLSQVRLRVETDYRRRKQEELTQRLFEDLTSRYKVEILAMPGNTAAADAAPGADGAHRENSDSNTEQ